MATKIRGITVEIGGDASGLEKALKGVNSKARSVQKELKDVERLLKLDPKNTELLAQKQKLLAENVSTAKEKLEALKQAEEQMKASGVDKNSEQYRALQREIISTEQSLKKAEKAAKEFGSVNLQKLKSNLQEVSNKAKQVQESTKAISAAGAVVAGGLIANAVNAGKTADELNSLAKQYNVTTEQIQKMNYAQDLIDVSTENMLGSYQKMTRQMGEGNAAFDELGVSITDASGEMRDANDVWFDTLKALSNIPNETKRDQMAMDIFGRSAAELAGVIDDGGEALKRLGQEAEDAGLILSQDGLDNANKFNDALDRLKATAQQAFLESGASLADTLIPALEKLVSVVSKVLSWFSNLDGSTQAFILTIAALIAAISPVAGVISAITGAAAALNVACLPMLGTIALIIAAVAAVIAIGVLLYKHWDEIKAKVVELKDKVVRKFNEIKDGITEKVNAIKQKVSDTFASVKYAITHPIETARDFVKKQIEKIKSFFNFKWSLPKLKMPHFNITGKFSLNPPSIPHIGVEWYAKAMQNGVIMNKPTVFGMNGANLMAGGEAGSEVVVGTNSLMSMIQKAAGGRNITMNVYGAQGQDVSQLADIVMEKIKFATDRKAAVFG